MGAGSTHASPNEKKEYYNTYHPNRVNTTKCNGDHWFRQVRFIGTTPIGVCRFLNTGKKYEIIQCTDCDIQRVNEL